jgi:hypothetical protein
MLLLCFSYSYSEFCPAPVRCRDLARPINACSPLLTTTTPVVQQALKPLCFEKYCERHSEKSERCLYQLRPFVMATLADLSIELKTFIARLWVPFTMYAQA